MGFQEEVLRGCDSKVLSQGKCCAEIELIEDSLNKASVHVGELRLLLLDHGEKGLTDGLKVPAHDQRCNEVLEEILASDLDDVHVPLTDLGAINEDLSEQADGVALPVSVLRVGEAVHKHLMQEPSLVVHGFLIVVDLICKKLLDEVLHLSYGSELESLFFSLEENFTVEETPEDLETELSLNVLLGSENFLKRKEVLFGIYNKRVFNTENEHEGKGV